MTVTLTPIVEQDAVELSAGSGKWKKQILPKGKFQYKGKTLDFDAIGPEVVKSFNAKALDQVAFQFADAGNNHNFDPKNYAGDLVSVELSDDGLYGVFDFSKHPETAKMVENNPKFGVSARIEQDLELGNGAKHAYAFSHVLGTLNPKVTGMKPWEKVELSNVDDSDEEIIDLSNADKEVDKVTAPVIDEATLAMLKEWKEEREAIATMLSNGDKDGEEKPSEALLLAQQTANDAIELAKSSQREAALERWERVSADLVRSGVPPVALDLAKPVMSTAKFDVKVIELSNGDKVDPQTQMLKMLEALKGTVDLSNSVGHEFSGDSDGTGGDNQAEFDAFRNAYVADQF